MFAFGFYEELVGKGFSVVFDAIDKKKSDYHTIRLFSQDETRYGLLPAAHRRITLAGIKPVAEIDYSWTSMSLYGAVDPVHGDHFFLEFRN